MFYKEGNRDKEKLNNLPKVQVIGGKARTGSKAMAVKCTWWPLHNYVDM